MCVRVCVIVYNICAACADSRANHCRQRGVVFLFSGKYSAVPAAAPIQKHVACSRFQADSAQALVARRRVGVQCVQGLRCEVYPHPAVYTVPGIDSFVGGILYFDAYYQYVHRRKRFQGRHFFIKSEAGGHQPDLGHDRYAVFQCN